MLIVVQLALMCGCAANPPSGWQRGGARLAIPRARWIAGELAVDLAANGHVRVAGQHRFTVDAAGRIYDPDSVPIALLGDDGQLRGIDDRLLGWVGAQQSNLPSSERPWLQLGPSGELARVDGNGQRRPFGVWLGCTHVGYTMQTCLLVSHLIALELRRSSGPAVGFGFGFGAMVPLR